MKKTFLIILILIVEGIATAAAGEPLNATRDEVCSVKEVLLGTEFGYEAYAVKSPGIPDVQIPEDPEYRRNKKMIEELTWLHVVGTIFPDVFSQDASHIIPPHGPDVGRLSFSAGTGGVTASSTSVPGMPATARAGRTTTYTLTLQDANGKILWSQSKNRFQGIKASSGRDYSEAHEVDETNAGEWIEMAGNLNQAVKGCGTKRSSPADVLARH
jgi:hypothetical protein